MKVIVLMVGCGSCLRLYIFIVLKLLVLVGGKLIVYCLVEDIVVLFFEFIDEIGFVIGDFGVEIENELIKVVEKFGVKGSIFYQDKLLGIVYVVLCVEKLLDGLVVVVFVDILFCVDFVIDLEVDGILWVKQIEDLSVFGVIKMNDVGEIIDFVEKLKEFVFDFVMIGIYYFKDGNVLVSEFNFLVENGIIKSGEYQLFDVLCCLMEKGKCFKLGEVEEWFDCGNKEVIVQINQCVLEFDMEKNILFVDLFVKVMNFVIIFFCFFGKDVVVENFVVGLYVLLGKGFMVINFIIKNSIFQNYVIIISVNLEDFMIGFYVKYKGLL